MLNSQLRQGMGSAIGVCVDPAKRDEVAVIKPPEEIRIRSSRCLVR
jgi:hypothetical protein